MPRAVPHTALQCREMPAGVPEKNCSPVHSAAFLVMSMERMVHLTAFLGTEA